MAKALSTPFVFIIKSKASMESKGFGVHLNESDYSELFVQELKKTRIVLSGLLRIVYIGIDEGSNPSFTDYAQPFGVLLQEDMLIITTVLVVSLTSV